MAVRAGADPVLWWDACEARPGAGGDVGEACADPSDGLEVDLEIPKVYRYNSDEYDDHGWGCVYRNLQTMLHATGREVPSMPELTRAMGTGDAWLREPGSRSLWVEPHDVAEYIRRFVPGCGDLRLVNVALRDGATLLNTRLCKVGTPHMYELVPRASPGEAGGSVASRMRTLVAGHLLRTRIPVLIDDAINSYLVVGFRSGRGGAEYRVLDPHYGMRYAPRGEGRKFDPEAGPDQFGSDALKDQWVAAEWLEEGRGQLNGYTPASTWLMLFVG